MRSLAYLPLTVLLAPIVDISVSSLSNFLSSLAKCSRSLGSFTYDFSYRSRSFLRLEELVSNSISLGLNMFLTRVKYDYLLYRLFHRYGQSILGNIERWVYD